MNANYPKIIFKPVSSYQFETREVPLNEPCKIGRAVGKIKPHRNNAIFDCKVLSRNHAIIWYENGKFYLRDTKSSNGTFANKRRLSEACEESEPYEIFSNDQIQFGVDVTDNLIVHPCIITQISVFHPDGKEAFHNSVTLSQRDLHKMSQILNEAKNKEQALSQKQKQFNMILEDILMATSDSWKAMVDEESLLSRILVLETELEIYRKPLEEDDLKKQLLDLTSTKYEEEMFLKNKMSQIYEEKVKVEANVEFLKNQILEKVNENELINRLLSEANEEVESLTESKTFLQEELTNAQTHLQQLEVKCKEAVEELEHKEEMLKSLDRECLRQQVDMLQAQLDSMKRFGHVASSLSLLPNADNSASDQHDFNVNKSPRCHHFEVRDINSPSQSFTEAVPSSQPAIWFRDTTSNSDATINPTFFNPHNDTSLISNDSFLWDNSTLSASSSTTTLNRSFFNDTSPSPQLPVSTKEIKRHLPGGVDLAESILPTPHLKQYVTDFNRKLDQQLATMDHLCMKKINDTSRKLMNCLTLTYNLVSNNKGERDSKMKMCERSEGVDLITELKEELVKKESVLKKETEMVRAKAQESENFKLLLSEGQKALRDREKVIALLKGDSEAATFRLNKMKLENVSLKAQLGALKESTSQHPSDKAESTDTDDLSHIQSTSVANLESQQPALISNKKATSYDKLSRLSASPACGSIDLPGSVRDSRSLVGNEEEELDRLSHNYQELAYQTKVGADEGSMMHDDSFAWQKLLLTEPYRFFNQFFHNTNNASNTTTLAIFLALLALLAFIILNYQ